MTTGKPSTETDSRDRALRERAGLVAEPFADRLDAESHAELIAAIQGALSTAVQHDECCIPLPGEPSFVLLGRDPQAPDLVETWADVRAIAEPSSPKPEMARRIASAMRAWKIGRPGLGMPVSLLGIGGASEGGLEAAVHP